MIRIEIGNLKTHIDSEVKYSISPPFFSKHTLVYFVLNILTMGIYGSHQHVLKLKSVQSLKHKQSNLQAVSEKINTFWSALESDLHQFKIYHATFSDEQLDHFRQRICELNITSFKNEAISLSTFIAHWIINCFTLGIATLYKNYLLDREAHHLAHQNTSAVDNIESTHIARNALLEKKITFLEQSQSANFENENLRQTAKGEFYQTTKEIERHNKEIAATNQTIAQLAAEHLNINQVNQQLRAEIEQLTQSKRTLDEQNFRLNEEINRLKEKKTQAEQTLEKMEVEGEKVEKLGMEIEAITDEISKYEGLMQSQKLLGEVARPIQVNIPEKFVNPAPNSFGFKEAKRAEEVVMCLFQEAFQTLSEANPFGIQFNRSSQIITNPNYIHHMKSFYRFVALLVIQNGKYFVDEAGELILKLNDRIPLRYSKPNVYTSKIGMQLFCENDSDDFFHQNLPSGIDPLAIKVIFESFTEKEKHFFIVLMMERLIPDDHQDLIDARNELQTNSTFAQKYSLASNDLIDFAYLIENRFINVLASLWEKEAGDGEAIPYQKQNPQTDARVSISFVPWLPKLEYFDHVLRGKWIETQQNQALIFQNMTKEAIYAPLKTSNRASLIEFNTQYYNSHIGLQHMSHPVLVRHGCLFTSLFSLMISDSRDLNHENVQKLKDAIVTYLNHSEVQKRYQQQIKNTHKVTITEYQTWLKTGSSGNINAMHNLDMGDIEIALVAELLGIRIGVVRQDSRTRLNEFGLIIPGDETHSPRDDTSYYGPMTKETLLLFNTTQPMTYCALWPKLKVGVMPANANEALLKLKPFWEAFS